MNTRGTKPNTLYKDAIQETSALTPPSKDPKFLKIWDRLMADYVEGYFIASDIPIIEQYILTTLKIDLVQMQLEHASFVVETPTGGTKCNPLLPMLSRLQADQRCYARGLRVGPSSRVPHTSMKNRIVDAPKGPKAPKMNVVPIAGKK